MRKQAGRIFFYSCIIVLASQISAQVFAQDFYVSLGAVLLCAAAFLLPDFDTVYVAGVSACGVVAVRVLASLITGSRTEASAFVPEWFFYILFGLLLHLAAQNPKIRRQIGYQIPVLIMIDTAANTMELLLRIGSRALRTENMVSILMIAVIRTFLSCSTIWFLRRYGKIVLQEEEKDRYRKLMLMTSSLNSEVIWMNKNAGMIEETMNTAYHLYRDMEERGMDEDLSKEALSIARNIHEVKKEYRLIVQGIAKALDQEMQSDTMQFSKLLYLLEEMVREWNRKEKRQIHLIQHMEEDFLTDKHYQLLSVFRNLYTNAREAEQNKDLRITLTQKRERDHQLFMIEDNGPGIPKEDVEEIFTPGFSTKINYATGETSRGLGLPMVKELVENSLGGVISVTSGETGTTFTIQVPAERL